MCLLHLTQFLGLKPEEDVENIEQNSGFSAAPSSDALVQIVRAADDDRMEELGLKDVAPARWSNVTYGLRSMAVEYEPMGQVDSIDIFHVIPLQQAATSREEWVDERLSKWQDFSRPSPDSML